MLDIRVLENEDINEVIDSWPKVEGDIYKLTFKDPTQMKKVLRVYTQDNMMKTMAIPYNMVARELQSALARKFKLIDTSQYRLILVEGDQQRVIDHNEKLFLLLQTFKENKNSSFTVYYRNPLTPIRKGSVNVSECLSLLFQKRNFIWH